MWVFNFSAFDCALMLLVAFIITCFVNPKLAFKVILYPFAFLLVVFLYDFSPFTLFISLICVMLIASYKKGLKSFKLSMN